jgi:hypothetical protein
VSVHVCVRVCVILNVYPARRPVLTSCGWATTRVHRRRDPLTILQIAVKNNVGIFYFQTPMPLHIFFAEDPAFERAEFPRLWQDIPAESEVVQEVGGFYFAR